MGHVHLTLDGRRIELSSKSLALLSYLALERRSYHREHLAALLWDTPEARQNLRVELTRMRSAGLELFPFSTRMLGLEAVSTDLELWERAAEGLMNQEQLSDWLGRVRGVPLSGLEDLGSPEFQDWVYQQVHGLSERIGVGLDRVQTAHTERGSLYAVSLITAKAEGLGLILSHASSSTPVPFREQGNATAPLHFEHPEVEAALRSSLERGQQEAMLVVLRGPAGSGKTYLADWLTRQANWPSVRVSSVRSSRLVLASLGSQLQRFVGSVQRQMLHELLVAPREIEKDLACLLGVIASMEQPLLLIFEQAQTASQEFVTLLEFLLGNLPRGLIVLTSREDLQASRLVRSVLRQMSHQHRLELTLGPPRLEAVMRVLEQLDPQPYTHAHLSQAHQLLQRSEGNISHILSLLEGKTLQHTPLASGIQEVYLGEAEGWDPELYLAMRYLSVIHAAFDEELACALLGSMGLSQPRRLLSSALEQGIVQQVAPGRTLAFPFWTPISDATLPDERFEFRRENLRIALSSTLPQPLRQELRRLLLPLMETRDVGLAAYYARRTGQHEEASRLLERHRLSLPEDSPLRRGQPEPQRWSRGRAVVPPAHSSAETSAMREQGYDVTLERGWLSLRRRGRYGHAETLRLLFSLPTLSEVGTERSGELRLVWRLDEFNGGYDMMPSKVPYALGVRLHRSSQLELFSPEALTPFREPGLNMQPHPRVWQDGWMEHRIPLTAHEGELLELSVRALDVAVLLGSLEWCGRSVLQLIQGSRTQLWGQDSRIG